MGRCLCQAQEVAIKNEQAFQHQADPATVFAATCQALFTLGFTIRWSDPAQGAIRAAKSMGLLSWGENLDLRVGGLPGGTSVVSVRSALKFGLFDWGKNKANVNAIHAEIARILAAGPVGASPSSPSSVAGAWHPDPSGRHQQRWWDGGSWTDAVLDADGTAPSLDPI